MYIFIHISEWFSLQQDLSDTYDVVEKNTEKKSRSSKPDQVCESVLVSVLSAVEAQLPPSHMDDILSSGELATAPL